jgi:carboxyl-terminal processing protease
MRAVQTVALTAALLFMLCAGIWIGGHPAKMPHFLRDWLVDSSGGLTAEATELIQDNYYRPVGETELGNDSLQGMARGLRKQFGDRFSEYFSPQNLKSFNEEINGRFSGIGLAVTGVKRGLRVDRVFHGSPAQRAGIEIGDVIVSVDGDSIAGESSEVSTAKIKGPEGTDVAVGVLDPHSDRVRALRLTRAQVELPITTSKVVKTANGRKLGYVRLSTFSEGAHAQLRRAVEKVEQQGAEGIVLDLRGNGGGLLEEAVLSASIFMPKDQVVVSTDSRTQGHSVYKTVGDNLPKRPLVVLIDRNTASSAEILTAALADDAGATVVGTRSYGKGVFQQEVELSNGGALKLTVGEYFTPDGTNLAGKGIRPDVRAKDDLKTRADEPMQRALGVLAGQVEG